MKRSLLALLLFAASCAPIRWDQPAALRDACLAPSYQLAGDAGTGSATCVGSSGGASIFLTAKHVVLPPGPLLLLRGNDVPRVATLVGISASQDLALVAVPDFVAPSAQLPTRAEARSLELLEPVVIVGYPGNAVLPHLTEGRLTERYGASDGWSAPIFFGNSGSGVFAAIGGEWKLVGVAVKMMTFRDEKSTVFATHVCGGPSAETVLDFLSDYLKGR